MSRIPLGTAAIRYLWSVNGLRATGRWKGFEAVMVQVHVNDKHHNAHVDTTCEYMYTCMTNAIIHAYMYNRSEKQA